MLTTIAILSHSFCPCDGFLQNGLCLFDWNWSKTNTNLGVIYRMLTTFRCERPTTRPYKWCYQPQHFTWNKKCPNNGHGWDLFVIFDLCKFATTQAIIIPYFVSTSLTYKAMTLYFISKKSCSFEKPNCYGFIHSSNSTWTMT